MNYMIANKDMASQLQGHPFTRKRGRLSCCHRLATLAFLDQNLNYYVLKGNVFLPCMDFWWRNPRERLGVECARHHARASTKLWAAPNRVISSRGSYSLVFSHAAKRFKHHVHLYHSLSTLGLARNSKTFTAVGFGWFLLFLLCLTTLPQ